VVAALFLLLGFVLLWKGGDLLVEGADRFARSHGVPATIAGVFILGFGTSVPELAVSAIAALDGDAGIAVGNVVGSNICNVALVLGCSALICPVLVNRFLLRVEIPVMVGVTVAGSVLLADGAVDRLDGWILLGAFLLYAGFALGTVGRRDLEPEEAPPPRRAKVDLGQAALALAAVIGGATLFKEGAVELAQWLGVSSTVIGLTVVALGTSLPELATSIAAARAGKSDLALGNVVGSNIFNLLLVLGVSSVLADQRVEPRVPRLDGPLMLLLALALWIPAAAKRRIGRVAGVALVAVYLLYSLGASQPEVSAWILDRVP
jgi:cation:H+ antiporter